MEDGAREMHTKNTPFVQQDLMDGYKRSKEMSCLLEGNFKKLFSPKNQEVFQLIFMYF